VLSVAHFNHQIRGAEADADELFVAALARTHGLEFHCQRGDAPAFARERRASLETAARELRYGWFRRLLAERVVDKAATAHTLDDQAETVLLRLLRGAGTRGLVGILPQFPVSSFQFSVEGEAERPHLAIVRPLLKTARPDLEQYLHGISQPWREDASNRDLKHARNRVRHVLLPLLEREFNPAIRNVLAETAEIARGEEDYWDQILNSRFSAPISGGALPAGLLAAQPVALQRRLVRQLAEQSGVPGLDFTHVEEVRELALATAIGKALALPGGWQAVVATTGPAGAPRELRFQRTANKGLPTAFEYKVPIPGEAQIAETGHVLRVTLVTMAAPEAGYNPEDVLDPRLLGTELVVRSWRSGDRFWPKHAKGPKKVKELLQRGRLPLLRNAAGIASGRLLWPVVVSGGKLAWMRGFGAAADFQAPAPTGRGVLIEELPSGSPDANSI
jgi:tRNA(Ile)-lysidine synthase